MKLNLKKIGAIVAGATILASSVAFASLYYKNTELVDQNGQPLVKVVVGAEGAASDGVAAANIAAKIANEAYVEKTLTATLEGTPSCKTAEGEEEGTETGTCTVSDKKAVLEITVPGQIVEGMATADTLIGDYWDRELKDRDESLKNYTYTTDTSSNSNPFTDGQGNALNDDLDYIEIYKIDGSDFTPFATETFSDPEAGSSYTYKEEQYLWVAGENSYSDTDDAVVGTLELVAYTIKFYDGSSDYGISACTKSEDDNYAYCLDNSTDADYRTSAHKLEIKFLGEWWILSEMGDLPDDVTSSSQVEDGGYIKLAKESVSGVINQGEYLELEDGVRLYLDDIVETSHEAAVSFQDANGNILKKEKISEGTTKEITISGNTYRIHVYKTVPGYTFGAKWADIAVYSHELKLESGKKLNEDEGDNDEWKVVLGWKNKDADTDKNQSDHLRTIILYTTDSYDLLDDDLQPGDYVPIVQNPVVWKLTYSGVDIDYSSDEDVDKYLKFEYKEDKTLKFTDGNKKLYEANGSTANEYYCNITGYVHVTSGQDGAVFTTGVGQNPQNVIGEGAEFWVIAPGATVTCTGTDYNPGSVIMPVSPGNDEEFVVLPYVTLASNGYNLSVGYETIGEHKTFDKGGLILIANRSDANASLTNYLSVFNKETTHPNAEAELYFGLWEQAGDGVALGKTDGFMFGLDTDGDEGFAIDDDTVFNNDEKILYNYSGPVNSGQTDAEEGFISERGTKFVDIDTDTVKFAAAKRLANVRLVLSTNTEDEEATSPDTVTKIVNEGDSVSVSGVTIKVKEIREKVGACTVEGAAAGCEVDMETVKPVITGMGTPAEQVTVQEVYGLTSNLVVLDKEATALDSGVVITVGGPAVNTKTAEVLQGSDVDFEATPVVVKEVGNTIVVAGLTAEDTLQAAENFISQLQRA